MTQRGLTSSRESKVPTATSAVQNPVNKTSSDNKKLHDQIWLDTYQPFGTLRYYQSLLYLVLMEVIFGITLIA